MRANIYGNLRVMIPLVYGKTDILNTRSIIRTAKKSLEREGLLYRDFPLGIMVETLSAVKAADELAGLCKFFSIGTNDLKAEISGIDRFKGGLTEDVTAGEKLTDAVRDIIASAKRKGLTVGICGETEGLDIGSLDLDYISR